MSDVIEHGQRHLSDMHRTHQESAMSASQDTIRDSVHSLALALEGERCAAVLLARTLSRILEGLAAGTPLDPDTLAGHLADLAGARLEVDEMVDAFADVLEVSS